jgi:hypothetical protein
VEILALRGLAPRLAAQRTSKRLQQILICSNYSGPYNYQPIEPFVLHAGVTYGISCRPTNVSEPISFRVFSTTDPDWPKFNWSPYLEQVSTYFVLTNNQWTTIDPQPGTGSNYFFFGPNFRFEPVITPNDTPFRITSISNPTNRTMVLQWESATNQLYLIKRSLSASRDFAVVLSSNLLATPPLNTFTDFTATNGTAYLLGANSTRNLT